MTSRFPPPYAPSSRARTPVALDLRYREDRAEHLMSPWISLIPRALRSPPVAGAGVAKPPLRRLLVLTALPDRVSTRSAISSSPSWSASRARSVSSRASRSETRCFSCPISSNVAIFHFPSDLPTSAITRLRRNLLIVCSSRINARHHLSERSLLRAELQLL